MSDLLFWLFPLLCCVMLLSQRGASLPKKGALIETWYVPEDIEAVYGLVVERVGEWRRSEEEKRASGSAVSRFFGSFGRSRGGERFRVKEEVPPRLLRVGDSSGPLYFELTGVEGGGTSVTVVYDYGIKGRVARLRAGLPLVIPGGPVGAGCPYCGKAVLDSFAVCPYCGERLIRES